MTYWPFSFQKRPLGTFASGKRLLHLENARPELQPDES